MMLSWLPSDGAMKRQRLDILVQEQAGVTRSKAQGMILAGQVYAPDGRKLDKPGLRIAEDMELEIRARPRFVSRGGEKLEEAFDVFRLHVEGRIAIDVGASTGGFTDCLLQHGAARVYAVDVGYGQLAWELRQDPRVVVMERCNIRHVTPEQFTPPPSFFTVDCSFISLRLVLPALCRILSPESEGVALIKPQFEAGRDQVGKGGVVRDTEVQARVVEEVCACAQTLGFQKIDVIPSPLLGPAGNREFLVYLRQDAGRCTTDQ